MIESVGSQGTRFIIGIVLARLLLPEMFGLISMLLIFITLGEIFVDSGFGVALIQKHNVTDLDICSVFYFNILIGFTAAILFFFTAPIIAAFYKQPLLTSMARCLSVIFIINSFGMIQINLLVKKIDFKSQAKLVTITNISSGFAGIAFAFMGYGVWSLVIQQISAAVIRNLLYWFYSDWRPRLLFSTRALQGMMKFGLSMLANGILNRTTESIYYTVIGKLFLASELGFFSRAMQLQSFPSATISMLVGRVTFPVLTKIQYEADIFKAGLRKTLTMLAFINFPLMIGMIAIAKPLIFVLLTDKWAASIPYLQLLSVVGLILPMEWIRQQAIQAVGHPNLTLRIEIYKKTVLLFSLAIMWYWGIYGIIIGMIIASILSLCLSIKYTAKLTQYSVKQQIDDMSPYFALSVLMGVVVFITGYFLIDADPLYQLGIQVFVGTIFYLGTARILRLSSLITIKEEICQLLK